MYKGFVHTHYLVVTLFLVLYVVKTILLLSDRRELLQKFTRKTRVFEMIVSALFLITGIYLAAQLPFNSRYDYLFWIKLVMVFASIPLAVVGFKRYNKILASLSLLLITGAYGLAEVYGAKRAREKATVQADDSTEEGSPRALYVQNCSLCHGTDGKLGASGAKDLTATTYDAAGITQIILNGKGLMRPIEVSSEEAQAIAGYVENTLRKSE